MTRRPLPLTRLLTVLALSLSIHALLVWALFAWWPTSVQVVGDGPSAQPIAVQLGVAPRGEMSSESVSDASEVVAQLPAELPVEPTTMAAPTATDIAQEPVISSIESSSIDTVPPSMPEPVVQEAMNPEAINPEAMIPETVDSNVSTSEEVAPPAVEPFVDPVVEDNPERLADSKASVHEELFPAGALTESLSNLASPEPSAVSGSPELAPATDLLAQRLTAALVEQLVYPERLRRRQLEDCVGVRIRVNADGALSLVELSEPSRQRDFNIAVALAVQQADTIAVVDVHSVLPTTLAVPVCFALRG